MPQAKQMAVFFFFINFFFRKNMFGDQTEEVPLHSGQIVWVDSSNEM